MKEELFKTIIGYDEIKETLCRIIDIIKYPDKYEKLGARIPHGLFLYGPPGTGKTSISNEIIKYLDRKTYTIRKTKSNGDFIKHINKIFEEAISNQPSIVFLDDIDKYAEDDDRSNNEEFVTIQSLIDSIKDKDIFVIATANDKHVLPHSLLRSGRFDNIIEIEEPSEEDAYKICKYYLGKKKIDKKVNFKNISSILSSASCADLEKVCNQAGIIAGYNNKKEIGMDELVKAALEFAYNTNINDLDKEDNYSLNISYHEAGHALVGELLQPKSVSFITVAKTDSDTRGLTIYHKEEDYFSDIKFMINRVKTLLAGKAATEIVYNTCDVGSNSDLHRAFDIVERFADNYCQYGFDAWVQNYREVSEKVKTNKGDKMIELMDKYYQEVKELLINNREKLDILANQLNKRKILFQNEIEDIYNNPDKYRKIN